MNILPIGAVSAAAPTTVDPFWQTTMQSSSTTSFTQILADKLEHLDHTVQAADKAVASFALNGNIPPHRVMMALEEASGEMQMMVQIRSHLIDGYQEIMRMQL